MDLLQYCFCFLFWYFGCEAHGISAPPPGIKAASCTLGDKVFAPGLPGKFLTGCLLFSCLSVVVVVQSLSRVQATPWTAAHQASLPFTISQSLLKLMSIEVVIPSNHVILRCPLLLLPSIFPSITVFSNESALLIRWPKNWSFSFSINPSNEYSGLISFRIDWFDLLAVQETLESLLQHHSLKA